MTEITINLDGEQLVLRPSLLAAQQLSRAAGGFVELNNRISKLDFDTIVSVVALGLGYGAGTTRQPQNLEERVWRTGLAELAVPCVQFVTLLANGGRPLAEAHDDTASPPPSR
jgi:hypothetical protein